MVADRDESERNVLTAAFDLHEKGCRILIRENSSLHSAVSKVYGPGSDGFFGNTRFDDEYQATHGSLAVGTLWDERDRWDPSVRFRLRLHLPQLDKRFQRVHRQG